MPKNPTGRPGGMRAGHQGGNRRVDWKPSFDTAHACNEDQHWLCGGPEGDHECVSHGTGCIPAWGATTSDPTTGIWMGPKGIAAKNRLFMNSPSLSRMVKDRQFAREQVIKAIRKAAPGVYADVR